MTFAQLLKPAAAALDLPATEAFAELRAHVARLDLPEGETVDWAHVRRSVGKLLTEQGKDLLLAGYAAFAPLALGLDVAPHTAVAFFGAFIDTYWDTMTPPQARPRARANCIAWFVTRLKATLPGQLTHMTPQERGALQQAWQKFAQTLDARLGSLAPSTSALLRLIEDATAPVATPPPQTAPPSPAGTHPAPTSALCQGQDARAIARSLCVLARQRRQNDPLDPQAARLWRVGLWLNVHIAPELLGELTRVTPVPAEVRARLTQMQLSGQWTQLHSLAEQSMLAHPLALDLQYYAATALTQMGGTQRVTSAMVRSETQALCRRIPELVELKAADGTALAMRETKAWLDVPSHTPQADAQKTAPSVAFAIRAQRRFDQQLKDAERALAQGHIDVAEAAFDRLGRYVARHRLDIWQPPLACRVLEGHLNALRQQTPPELKRVRQAFRRWAVLASKATGTQMTDSAMPLGQRHP